MPPVSKIKKIPQKLREEFNAELIAGGFSDYERLTDWLNERLKAQGLDVTVSIMTANRYGRDFKAEFEADMSEANQTYQIAKQALANNEDTEGVVRDATIRTLQTRLLKITSSLRQLEESGGEPADPHKLAETTSRIAKAVADLSRTDIMSQKFKTDELAAYMDILKRLGEFIAARFPQHRGVFGEILEPFAKTLAK